MYQMSIAVVNRAFLKYIMMDALSFDGIKCFGKFTEPKVSDLLYSIKRFIV